MGSRPRANGPAPTGTVASSGRIGPLAKPKTDTVLAPKLATYAWCAGGATAPASTMTPRGWSPVGRVAFSRRVTKNLHLSECLVGWLNVSKARSCFRLHSAHDEGHRSAKRWRR